MKITISPTQTIVGKQVDVTPLFEKAGLSTPHPIVITETRGMYPYKPEIEQNWAYFTAVGMMHFRQTLQHEGRLPSQIGIVGICSGVEGIAVLTIFQDCARELVITDIDEEILQGTVWNLSHAVPQSQAKIVPLVGSFCEPMEEEGILVDFVLANIPNLPAHGSEDLTLGAEKGTFLPPGLYEKYQSPQKYIEWALGAQYAYLQSACKVVNPGGSVITELGGRVPISLVQELFADCGLSNCQEIIVGFKRQTEALIDFRGYHEFEKEFGVSFDFYLYEKAMEKFKAAQFRNPTAEVSGGYVKDLLSEFRVSSGDALKLYEQGTEIGHTVHLFRGVKQ